MFIGHMKWAKQWVKCSMVLILCSCSTIFLCSIVVSAWLEIRSAVEEVQKVRTRGNSKRSNELTSFWARDCHLIYNKIT